MCCTSGLNFTGMVCVCVCVFRSSNHMQLANVDYIQLMRSAIFVLYPNPK